MDNKNKANELFSKYRLFKSDMLRIVFFLQFFTIFQAQSKSIQREM